MKHLSKAIVALLAIAFSLASAQAATLGRTAVPGALGTGLTSSAATLFWTDASLGTIDRANVDGSSPTVLATGQVNPLGMALDVAGGKMYWVEGDGQKIRRANLDGSSIDDLVVGVGPSNIALDLASAKMYWTDVFVTGRIQRANLDGSGVEDLVPAVGDREGLALDVAGGKMYWTNRSYGWIQRANLDGTGSEALLMGLSDPRGIALDTTAGKMYWADLGMHKIQRANTDGSAVEDLVTGLALPDGIALDLAGGKMYWTDFGTHKIQRANLDGTQVEDLLTGLGIPVGIALAAPSSPGPLKVAGSGTFGVTSQTVTSTMLADGNVITVVEIAGPVAGVQSGTFVVDVRNIVHPTGVHEYQGTYAFTGSVAGIGAGTLSGNITDQGPSPGVFSGQIAIISGTGALSGLRGGVFFNSPPPTYSVMFVMPST